MKALIIVFLVLCLTSSAVAQDDAEIQEQITRSHALYRSPSTALFWSAIMVGGGQFYNNQPVKGMAFLGTTIAGYIVAVTAEEVAVGIGVAMLSWIISMGDAYSSAKANNTKNGLADNKGILPKLAFSNNMLKIGITYNW